MSELTEARSVETNDAQQQEEEGNFSSKYSTAITTDESRHRIYPVTEGDLSNQTKIVYQ